MNKTKQKEIKEQLTTLFSSFILEPGNKEYAKQALALEKNHFSLLSYAQHSAEELLHPLLLKAIGQLGAIYQYGLYDDKHPAFTNKKIVDNIKVVLDELRELQL